MLNAASPAGLRFLEVCVLPEGRGAAEVVRQARYEARLGSVPSSEALSRLARAAAGEEFPVCRTRKGIVEKVRLQDSLRDLSWDESGKVTFTIFAEGGSAPRPGEILAGILGEAAEGVRIQRTEMWFERDGKLVRPLAGPATGPALVQ
jgi:hypothetical protein